MEGNQNIPRKDVAAGNQNIPRKYVAAGRMFPKLPQLKSIPHAEERTPDSGGPSAPTETLETGDVRNVPVTDRKAALCTVESALIRSMHTVKNTYKRNRASSVPGIDTSVRVALSEQHVVRDKHFKMFMAFAHLSPSDLMCS